MSLPIKKRRYIPLTTILSIPEPPLTYLDTLPNEMLEHIRGWAGPTKGWELLFLPRHQSQALGNSLGSLLMLGIFPQCFRFVIPSHPPYCI